MMRRSIRLTSRGRGMLLGGAAVAAAGAAIDSRVVRTAGLFAIALLGLAAAWVLVLAWRTTIRRAGVPATLSCDEQFQAVAIVHRPIGGYAHVAGLLPRWAAGSRRRGSAFRLRQGPTSLAATGTARRRGHFRWPTIILQTPDPLGVVHGVVRGPDPATTVVFPRVEQLGSAGLPPVPGGLSDLDGAVVPAQRPPRDPAANPIPRPYQTGDSPRRMHWPATARAGAPMVRAEDSPPLRRAVVLLDTGGPAYLDEEGFERAVSAAASIAARLLHIGWAVSLRVPDGSGLTAPAWVEGRSGETAVLMVLAGVARGPRTISAPQPRERVDAVFAITGGGRASAWPLPPTTAIRTEAGEHEHCLVWDGTRPLAALWAAGASRPVHP